MRCIQYATGEYLIYNDIVAIALSGYRQTDHVGVDLAEDRPLSEDEVLESLLDIDGVQVEEKEHLDEYQRELLESISLHHPSFRHKVEALGFAFSHLAEARRPKNRQAKKDAKKLAQKKAGEIPPQDQGKDTAPKPREVPKGVEVDKEGKPVPPPEKPASQGNPTGPGSAAQPSTTPQSNKGAPKKKGYFEQFLNSLSKDKKDKVDKVYREIFGDNYKYKDMRLSQKQIDDLKKGLVQEGLTADDVKKQFSVMHQDVRWAHFLDLSDDDYTLPRVAAKPSWDTKWDGKKWGEIRRLLNEALCHETKVEKDELKIGEAKIGDQKVDDNTVITNKDIDDLSFDVVMDTNSTFQKVVNTDRFKEQHNNGKKAKKGSGAKRFIIKDRLIDHWDKTWGDKVRVSDLPNELSLILQDMVKEETKKKLDPNKIDDIWLEPDLDQEELLKKDASKYHFVVMCSDKETAEKIAKTLGLSAQEIKEE